MCVCVCAHEGRGGDGANSGGRRGHGQARLLEMSEEAKLREDRTDAYRVVAAVQAQILNSPP